MEIPKKTSKAVVWTSCILQSILVIMFLIGAIMNLLQTEQSVNGALEMGYQKESVFYLGMALLIGTLLYAFPKTVIFGAIILTGWLGGAVATHVIHKDPVFNMIFPVIFGIIMWLSIWLRSEKLKKLLAY